MAKQKQDIKKAYKSLCRTDRKELKTYFCNTFGYGERNFQAKMAGDKTWSIKERHEFINYMSKINS